jgi:hypothetical protein
MLLLLLFLGLLGVRPAEAQQVRFLNITAPYQNFTSTCISVLNQAVSCDPKVLDAGKDETLASVCTTTCTSSLTTWVRRVLGACSTSRYLDGKASVLASALGQAVLERYSVLCLKNP